MHRIFVALLVATGLVLTAGAAMADGDTVNGEKLFKRCAVCHTASAGAANRIGPNLFGVVGAIAGKRATGFKYSPALSGSAIVWTDEMLDAWLTSPQKLVPGTRMTFAGINNADQRADVVAYLKTLK